jgi:hypothetical protein
VILSLVIDVRLIQGISGFNLKRVKKLPDGAVVQKYQKQILKQWYLHYWHAPRGARGVKKSGTPNWRPLWWVGALRFRPNWTKFEKPLENRVSLTILFNFDSISQFLQFWLNLSAPTQQSGLQFGHPDFLTPLAPLGARQ